MIFAFSNNFLVTTFGEKRVVAFGDKSLNLDLERLLF